MNCEESEDTSRKKPVQECSSLGFRPTGRIQKISQEGSKNTYMIILSKDWIKSSAPSNPSSEFLKYGSKDFDSPTENVHVGRSKKISKEMPEDVKLNLSNINDEEYDSNVSASSVFLKEDSGVFEQDSCDINNRNSEKIMLHTEPTKYHYIIKSPVGDKQSEKPDMDQHSFPVASNGRSLLATSDTSDRSQAAAKQLIFPTPKTCESSGKSLLNLKPCGGSFTNEAVPVMGKSLLTPFNKPSSTLPKSNSKAVPTFNDISPISQNFMPSQSSKFVPINPAQTANNVASSSRPLTSTPILADPRSRKDKHQLEVSTHRPVYIIPSPFARQNTSSNACTPTSLQKSTQLFATVGQSPASILSTPSFNNSSGFISGSSSIETPDEQSYRSSASDGYTEMDPDLDIRRPVSTGQSMDEASIAVRHISDGSGGVIINVNDEAIPGLDTESLTSSQESIGTNEGRKGTGLNRSLTNIQWLKSMQLKEDASNNTQQNLTNQYQHMQWTAMSRKEILEICSEYSENKRPPFSYMVLIQMALCCAPERRLMLKEICTWIEQVFPYYKATGKRGWKNSIRHNLSLYNIFERETGKRHGSYWTIKDNVEPKTKSYQRPKHSDSDRGEVHRSTPTLPSQIPLIPIHAGQGQLSAITPRALHQSLTMPQPAAHSCHTGTKKKVPPPILPRPTSYTAPQAYALIPLSTMNALSVASPSPSQQHVILQNLAAASNSGQNSACPSPIISEVSAAVASIQVSSASPIPPDTYCDPAAVSQEHFYTKKPPPNILKQAWIDCQNNEAASSIDSENGANTDQVSTSSEVASSSEFYNRSKSKRPRVKPGLPKPRMYTKDMESSKKSQATKRRKLLQQKERQLESSSSDEEIDDGTKFISNLEKEIFSVKPEGFSSLESDVMEEMLTTSTPSQRKLATRTELPSPIHALTPLRGSGLFDTSFLEGLSEKKGLNLSPDLHGMKRLNAGDSPDMSLVDFNVFPFTSPDKLEGSPNNGNLSRILSECGLDPSCMNHGDAFPELSWSDQQIDEIVDTMDTN